MITANLMQLDHPDGVLRMSTLPYDWTDPEGRTWIGGGAVLSLTARGPQGGLDGGAIVVTWNGASQALIAEASAADLLRSRLWLATVWLADDGQTREHGPIDAWAGLVETPEINADPAAPSITLTAQSPLLDLGRSRRVTFSPEEQKRLDPDDTSADWIAGLADYLPKLKLS